MFRGNQRRRQNRGRRPPPQRADIPKSLTANAPFALRSSRQMVSIPSHPSGLTIYRKVRRRITSLDTGAPVAISYQQVFDTFLNECAISIPTTSRVTFSCARVDVFAEGLSCSLELYDEPRSGTTANSFNNAPYFAAQDDATTAGVSHIAAMIPKAAVYTVSTDEPANLKNLPFASVAALSVGVMYLDITGTFTIKSVVPALLRLSAADFPDLPDPNPPRESQRSTLWCSRGARVV